MNVFDLVAKISLDSSEYEQGLEDASDKTSSFGGGIKKAFGTVAKVGGAALVAGATAAVGIAKSATDAYSSYEQLTGGVETLFKESAPKVMEYADNAYKTAGLSANQYMETVTSFSASLLQSVGGDTAMAAQYADTAIRDMSDNANKMGSSMDSIQNAYQGFAKQNYTMLDNLKLGYGGTKTEMERLIGDAEQLDASFSAARDENGDLAMSYSDIVEAIHIVQSEMGITGTTALEAADTVAGSAGSMSAAWDNLMVALASGENIQQRIDEVVASATTYAGNMVPVFVSALKGIGTAIGELAPVIITEIPKLVGEILPSLLSAASSIVGAVFDMLMTLIAETDWVQLGHDIVQFIMNIDWAGLVSGAASLLGGLAGAIFGLLQGIFEEAVSGIGEWLYGYFGDTAELTWEGFLAGLASALADIGSWIMTNVVDPLVKGFCDALGLDGDAAVQAMHEWISGAMDALVQAVHNATAWGRQLVENVKSGFSSAWGSVKTFFTNSFNSIKEIVQKPFDSAKDIVKKAIDFIKGLFNFSWSLPKLKLPHFSVGKGPTVLGIDLPKINIEWYKKAYENPYMFNQPTVVGNRGFGDGNGGEMVYGHSNLMRDIRSAVVDVLTGSTFNPSIRLYLDGDKLVGGTADQMDTTLGNMREYKLRWEGV